MRPRGGMALPILLSGLAAMACKRSPGSRNSQPLGSPPPVPRDALCVEQPEGCVYCNSRDSGSLPFLEADQSRPVICDPKDEENCLEFCTTLAPECALPWSGKPRCTLDGELAFQRATFNRDTFDRPEVILSGRVVDESGRRLEGVHVDVWVARGTEQTALAEEVSGKDGSFKVRLRNGPWTYSSTLPAPGLGQRDRRTSAGRKAAADGGGPAPGFPPGRGEHDQGAHRRWLDPSVPVADAEVAALRASEDGVASGTARTGEDGSFVLGGLEVHRYYLRISKFGWRPLVMKGVQAGSGVRVPIKLARATVIRGSVRDKDGDPEPNATVAAVLSEVPGVPTTPIFWTSDHSGLFAQDRFAPGTYYLWARKGDMLAYPPEKIELPDGADVDVSLILGQKGSRVSGHVVVAQPGALPSGIRALLISRSSPLAFPRPAVASVDGSDGHFSFTGILPGRYELSMRDGTKTLTIVAGPRDVEIPIDSDVSVPLQEAVTVRPRIAE